MVSRPNENCWDEVAGHAFTRDLDQGRNTLHLLTQSSTVDDIPGDAFAWPFGEDKIPRPAEWTELVQQHQSLFDEEYGLNGQVTTRMYGMAASPIRDEVVLALSLHPSHLIQYSIHAHQETVLVFGSCQGERDDFDQVLLNTSYFSKSLGKAQPGNANGQIKMASSIEASILSLKTHLAQPPSEEDPPSQRHPNIEAKTHFLSDDDEDQNNLKSVSDF